ncbi:MAG: thioredoxin family protein [Metamycoplasmataceae bacterium]
MIRQMKWSEAQKLIKESKIMYLFIGADWCGDCIMMEPIVNELKDHFAENREVNFIKIDAEESKLFRDEESKYKVLKIPTHVFMKEGKIMSIKYEYTPLKIMIEEINKLL